MLWWSERRRSQFFPCLGEIFSGKWAWRKAPHFFTENKRDRMVSYRDGHCFLAAVWSCKNESAKPKSGKTRLHLCTHGTPSCTQSNNERGSPSAMAIHRRLVVWSQWSSSNVVTICNYSREDLVSSSAYWVRVFTKPADQKMTASKISLPQSVPKTTEKFFLLYNTPTLVAAYKNNIYMEMLSGIRELEKHGCSARGKSLEWYLDIHWNRKFLLWLLISVHLLHDNGLAACYNVTQRRFFTLFRAQVTRWCASLGDQGERADYKAVWEHSDAVNQWRVCWLPSSWAVCMLFLLVKFLARSMKNNL